MHVAAMVILLLKLSVEVESQKTAKHNRSNVQ